MSGDFLGQVVIVTGGTRGIGAGISRAFLQQGARVIATYARNDEKALAFKASLAELGESLTLRKFDVSCEEEVLAFYQFFADNFDRLDVLVNNSGIKRDAVCALMESDDWKKVMEVNLDGTFYMCKSAITHFMQNRFGRIINMSSIAGTMGIAGQVNYTASKAAQMGFSKSLAKEVAKKGITVNCICPGFIETELIENLPAEQIKEYKKQVPMRRFGKVEEVAAAVLFLASPLASYITGTEINITGGLH